MQVHNVNLTVSAVTAEQYPQATYPEIAFVGHSNVGKSSLLNALINRKNYAHISNRPGKTQTLNFYQIERQLYFVDVPGYGYAKVSKQKRNQFGKMVEGYLTTRSVLCGVIQLVDARHAPTKDDQMMYQWLTYYQLPVVVVATKVDKVKASSYNRAVKLIRTGLTMTDRQTMILFSATTKRGKDQVWQWIENQAGMSSNQ